MVNTTPKPMNVLIMIIKKLVPVSVKAYRCFYC
jgi:hypothetical protein